MGAHKNAMQFMPAGMKNGEEKVLVHGSGPHPLFIGLHQTSSSSYRSIRYPINMPSTLLGSTRHDLRHGKIRLENGPLPPRSYFSPLM